MPEFKKKIKKNFFLNPFKKFFFPSLFGRRKTSAVCRTFHIWKGWTKEKRRHFAISWNHCTKREYTALVWDGTSLSITECCMTWWPVWEGNLDAPRLKRTRVGYCIEMGEIRRPVSRTLCIVKVIHSYATIIRVTRWVGFGGGRGVWVSNGRGNFFA